VAELNKQKAALDQRSDAADKAVDKDNKLAVGASLAASALLPMVPLVGALIPAFIKLGGDGAEATATVTKAQEKLRNAAKENVAGFIELSNAVRKSEDSLKLLGVTAETDAKKVTANKLEIRAMLDAAIDPKLDDGKQAEARAKNEHAARILAKYDLDELSAALEAAGISMSDLGKMSTNDMVEALDKAAAATGEALAQATGLSEALANLAVAYDAAHKAAKTFTDTLYTGNNEWLAGLAGADAYRSSLDALVYTTDFTAANLGKVADSFQSLIDQTYADSIANSTVTDTTQKTIDAMTAAAGKSDELRQQFIDQALATGKPREEAEKLANALFGIPGTIDVNIKILVDQTALDEATAKLKALQDAQVNSGNPFAIIGNAVAIGNAQGDVNAKTDTRNADQLAAAWYAGANKKAQEDAAIATAQQQQAAENARKADEEARRKQEETARENQKALEAYFKSVNAENERALKEAADNQKKAEVDAARTAKELADAQDKAEQERQRIIAGIESASDSLTNSLEGFIKSFQSERKTLIGDIRKKVEFEQATSVTSLIRNADKRNAALTEASAGLIALRQRGLSSDAITAMGLTGRAEDAKAIRRLLSATPAELAKLSSSVGKLGATATQAAYKEQGEIIGREVRDVLKTWLATPGVVATTLDVTAISNLIVGATGNTEASAVNISTQLGGVTKR